jgi:hypothetical protein
VFRQKECEEVKTLEDAYAVFQNPYATYSDMQAAQAFIDANESLAPVQGLIAPEEGYTYGDIVPIRTNQETGQRELTVPMMAREGVQSLLNIAQGSQTGVVNPEDVMNVMPMGGAASLLDEGIEGGFTAGMFIGRGNPVARKEAFDMASDLKNKGYSDREIYEITGDELGTSIFYGRDGNPRQEVSDAHKMSFDYINRSIDQVGPDKPHYAPYLDLGDSSFVSDPAYAKMIAGRTEAIPSITIMSHTDALNDLTLRGSFDPDTFSIKINPYRQDPSDPNGYVKRTPDEIRSTVLHEIQHKIQKDDGLSRGSNESRGMTEAQNFASKAQTIADDASAQVQNARSRVSDIGKAEKADEIYQIANALEKGVDPVSIGIIKKTMEVRPEYKRVRRAYEELNGPEPEAGSAGHQAWLSGLAVRLSDEIESTMKNKDLVGLPPDELKHRYNIAYRQAYNTKEAMNFDQLDQAAKDIGDRYMSLLHTPDRNYTAYRRKLGEVEARNTQRREMMDDRARRSIYPEDIYDVDPQDIIFEPMFLNPDTLLGTKTPRK